MGRMSVNELRPFGEMRESTDRWNDIADVFYSEIRETLRTTILPGDFGETFERAYAPLYVGNREWVMAMAKLPGEFRYEQYLHNCYWPICSSGDNPFLVIKGKEGVGKSSLLRFYFDCYLPHYSQFPHLRERDLSLESFTEREVAKHIILHVDLQLPATFKSAKSHIFRQFREAIRLRFPKISAEKNYAMWQRVAKWDDPARRKAEATYPDKSAYRAKWVDDHLDDDERFVREALWYLNSQKGTRGNKRYYITQVFDNIDLLDIDIQERLLKEIIAWIKYDRCQWKVIIPLRPETLRQVVHLVGPIQGIETIELGNVDYAELLRTRQEDLEWQIKDSGKQVERDRFLREPKTTVFHPIPNFLVREYMKDMLTLQLASQSGQTPASISVYPITQELMLKFCNGSIRRFLRILKRLVVSIPVQRAAEQRVLHEDKPFTHYVLLNGWLTGSRDYFDENDEDNDILNLYKATNLEPSPYTLLIGVHTAYLLSQGQSFTRSHTIDLLSQIGYKREEVDECLESLRNHGFFKRETVDRSGDYRIFVESDVVEAHLRLAEEPAYVDNMAIVTPVREDFSRMKMSHTVPYSVGQFRERVSTSFHFMQQIRDDENVARTWRDDMPRYRMKSDVFEKAFNLLNLPSVYRKAAVQYRARLQALQELPGNLREVMSKRHWDALLRDPILNLGCDDPDKPLSACLHKPTAK